MNTEKIIGLITAEIEKLNSYDFDSFSGDTLSRIAVRLAAYKAGLGSHVTSAKKDMWMAEKALKEAKAREFMRLRRDKLPVGDAKEMAVLGVEKEYSAFISAQEIADGVSGLSYNVHDLIDSIKSRLIHQQMEKSENGVH